MRERSQRLAEQSQARVQAYAQSGVPGFTSDPASTPTSVTPYQSSTTVVDAPLPQVLEQVAHDSKQLLTQELHLAKAEMTRKAKDAGKGAGMLGAAAITALFALAVLSAAAILGLAVVMPPAIAALIVGGVYLVVAAVLVVAGRSSVRQATPFVPEQTVRTLGALGSKLGRAWQRGQA